MNEENYVIRVLDSAKQISASQWNNLLERQAHPTPFMRHEYLSALQETGCATVATGWVPHFITLQNSDGELRAGCLLYLKTHSRGEYVFDWGWAEAYARHGLRYYPKALIAVPFTPVTGSRLLAIDARARASLVKTLMTICNDQKLPSLHLLFGSAEDISACKQAGMMVRQTVQFHWHNRASTGISPPDESSTQNSNPVAPDSSPMTGRDLHYGNFDAFLASLSQEKRKKIRQERRKVAQAGVSFRAIRGRDIRPQDWDFFYQCYERTYLEHGNPPYLNRAFFQHMADSLPNNWVLFVAERQGRQIAASLIAVDGPSASSTAWGRYWGALERVDCLHFEACYYQPLEWCIEHGIARFEGGAQGEHKLARALLPVKTQSAHWLSHPEFADAVERFLANESEGISNYVSELESRSPLKRGT